MYFSLRTTPLSLLVVSALGVSALVPAASAQSLWAKSHPAKAFLFFDTQARVVGDLITVVISENTDVDNSDQRAMDRGTSATGGFGLAGAAAGILGNATGDSTMDVNTNGSGDYEGASSYSVERGFADRITVSVVDCLPNGNLLISGKRERLVAGERRTLVVSGVVRPMDIRADNSILSQFIGNFTICYDGDGIETRYTEQGWLTRCWNKYRPF